MDAAIKGDTISNVVTGKATSHPLPGSAAWLAAQGDGSGGGAGTTGTGSTPSLAPGTYTNPVPGASTGRIDWGVDYALGPQGFVAPGRSKIVNVSSGGGWGNEYVAGQLLDGPLAGKMWYIAEAATMSAAWKVGDIVQAGQQIVPQGSSTGGAIEAGWTQASNLGGSLAPGPDQGEAALTAGYSFSQFVSALGGVAGEFQGAGAALANAVKGLWHGTDHPAGVPF